MPQRCSSRSVNLIVFSNRSRESLLDWLREYRQSISAEHVEHVKTMVGMRPGRCFAQHQVTRAAGQLLAEPLPQRVVQLAHLDALEQLVADPVSLDDTRVERVG